MNNLTRHSGKRRFFALLISLFLTLQLLSCREENPAPKSRTYFDYFDTFITVYDYTGGTEAEFSELLSTVEEELSIYHKLYDIYNEYEGIGSPNLASINRLAGSGKIKCDKKIIDLIDYSLELYSLTNGGFNFAMGSVLSIWHTYREEGKALPPYDALLSASFHMNPDNILIDRDNMTLELTDSEMRIDVGAVAKGYAEEKIAELLIEKGYSGIVLDFGGNLRAIGSKKDGSGWSVGIKNPKNPYGNDYVKTLTLKNSALSTSGTYERYYTVDGKNYHHIIDPKTLFPAENYISLSVKSPSAALSDALSTALFNMTTEEIESFVSSKKDILVIAVKPDGEILSFGNE